MTGKDLMIIDLSQLIAHANQVCEKYEEKNSQPSAYANFQTWDVTSCFGGYLHLVENSEYSIAFQHRELALVKMQLVCMNMQHDDNAIMEFIRNRDLLK